MNTSFDSTSVVVIIVFCPSLSDLISVCNCKRTSSIFVVPVLDWSANVTNRIMAQQPDIAGRPLQHELENASNTQNPLLTTKAPPIEHMRRSPRLHKSSTDSEGMQKLHRKKVIEERIKAFKEIIGIKQPKPRVSDTPPHLQG